MLPSDGMQDIIRSSVVQDQSSTQVKSLASPLEIKLPMPSTVSGSQQTLAASASTINPTRTVEDDNGDEEEEEDDWEGFQSFPASSANVADENSNAPVEKDESEFGNDDDEFAAFQTEDNTEGTSNIDNFDLIENDIGESIKAALPIEEKVAAESSRHEDGEGDGMEESSLTPPPESSSDGDSEKETTEAEKTNNEQHQVDDEIKSSD